MPTLQTLINRTSRVTVFRGHTMSRFLKSKNGNGVISECTICKALAIIMITPPPGDIGGGAIAQNCPVRRQAESAYGSAANNGQRK